LTKCDLGVGEGFQVGLTPSRETIFRVLNRKLRAIHFVPRVVPRQVEHEEVQSTPKVMDELADELVGTERRRIDRARVDLYLLGVRIEVVGDSLLLRELKPPEERPEFVQFFSCPEYADLCAPQGVVSGDCHDLTLEGDARRIGRTSDTAHREGLRNTDPDQGRSVP
jgi:hypothetical protein